MKRRNYYILFLLMWVVLSCSSRRNTSFSRGYHALTARYNIYFNGHSHFEEELKSMEKGYLDNYTRLILLHPVSAYGRPKEPQPSGSFDRTIEKCQKAIREHSIKKQPTRNPSKMSDPKYKAWVNRTEYNPFIDRVWKELGLAQLYKGDFLAASATFTYISRTFTWKPLLLAECQLYTARAYIELEWLYEAENLLNKVNTDKMPVEVNGLYATTQAALYVAQKNYKEAITPLQAGIDNERHRPQKNRMKFLLAQLHALSGNNEAAYNLYQEVIKSNPTYRMEFNARIKQTEVMPPTRTREVLKSLNRMARRDNNKDFLDQVYYAIGNVYLSQKDTVNTLSNYLKAVDKSTRSGIEKAQAQIALADLYFTQRIYTKAQPHYAEALPAIDKSYPNYTRIKSRSDVLDELVVFAQNVELQDSLLRLAAMPEKERLEVIDRIIAEVIRVEKEEERAKALALHQEKAEENTMLNGFAPPPPVMKVPTVQSGDNAWYFYNTQLITAGKTEFQRRWGRRKLEDNWRRRNKQSFGNELFGGTPETEPTDSLANNTATTPKEGAEEKVDIKDPNFYLKQIPLTPEEQAISHEVIREGLFNMGLILKDKLEDFEAALASFGTLDTRYPNNEYRLEMYYNIYLLFMRQGKEEQAEVYRQQILSLFGESKYAQALSNPHFLRDLHEIGGQQDSIYQTTYTAYLDNRPNEVHEAYRRIRSNFPTSTLMPKFMFINALSYINENDIPAFKTHMQELLQEYPDSDVSPLVTDMLKGIIKGKEVQVGSHTPRTMNWDISLGGSVSDSLAAATDSTKQFKHLPDVPHLVIFAYDTDSVSANELLFEVARFNFTTFVSRDFDLDAQRYNKLGILYVKGFNNYDEITQYRQILHSPKGFLVPHGVRFIAINDDNYRMLLEGFTLEDYFLWEEREELMKEITHEKP